MIIEPDGLGIIPFNTDINGNLEWCQPTDEAGNPQPGDSPEDRYAALNYAVDVLSSLRNVSVYLDGTHSAWLGVGDIADRLSRPVCNEPTGSTSMPRTTRPPRVWKVRKLDLWVHRLR